MTQSHASADTREELALLRIAAPLMISYVADVTGVVITKAVVGRLGFLELAGVGVAADISFQLFIICKGFFAVVGVLVAGALGARQRERIMVALLQGLWLALVIGIALTILVWNLESILRFAGQSPEVLAIAGPFARAFSLAMLPMLLFAVLQGLAAAMMRTGMVMAIVVASAVLQYFIMTGFVHGAGLGAAGAGYGWAALAWLRLACLALFVVWLLRREQVPLPHGEMSRSIWHPAGFIRLGLPIAGIVGLESGLFGMASLMSGWLGPIELAAYQMLMGWIAIPFVISLGLADAAMVRVSYWIGAQRPDLARKAGNLGMLIGVGIPAVMVLIPLFAPQLITRAFLDRSDPAYAEIAALVASLLVICAVFQIFDSLQAVASHVLRGLKDAAMPLVIAGIGYWIIGLTSSYLLAFKAGWGAHGLWWGVALGLAFTGTLLAYRFERLSSQG